MYNYSPLWETMKDRGVTTYSLVNHYGISSHLMSNLRHNKNVTVETIHRLCNILDCTPNDILQIEKDNRKE
ncbi:MAG: helix-turn-helix transcriptional regulator [Lachnospiraceae bacterium]|nr:helix-turn-helix transcriptional regulator [Lachnospiraceae bacterium]